jgi:hypothetical protein
MGAAMKRAVAALALVALSACATGAGGGKKFGDTGFGPRPGGGGGAVSSVTGSGVISCSPTTGSVVCSAPTVQSSSAVTITGGTITGTTIALAGSQLSDGIVSVTGSTGVLANPSLTGLTYSGATLRNDFSTGKSGGLTVIGDTASGGNLLFTSTANATKGKIGFGTIGLGTGAYFDENDNVLVIGNSTTADTSSIIHVVRNINSNIGISISNTSSGGSASSFFKLESVTSGTGAKFLMAMNGTGNSSAPGGASGLQMQLFGGSGNLDLSIGQSAGIITFGTGSSGTARLSILASGLLQFASTSFVANGSQVLTAGGTGPAGIGTTTATKYLTFQDGSGTTSYIPVWQ